MSCALVERLAAGCDLAGDVGESADAITNSEVQ